MTQRKTLLSLAFVSAFLAAQTGSADRPDEIKSLWNSFQQNSVQFLKQVPPKWDQSGMPVSSGESRFPGDVTSNQEFVRIKSSYPGPRAFANNPHHFNFLSMNTEGFEGSDGLDSIPETIKYRTLQDIEKNRLMTFKLKESPWSGDYWPTYQGVIARRYADARFPGSTDWKVNADYILDQINDTNASSMDQLSPAEKYDLIVGDERHTLTIQMINEGKRFHDSTGTVEPWMGICHGWAPASYRVSRPGKAVKALASDGTTWINFYPSDIKGLVTALWANVDYPSRFGGRRCNKKDPQTDENGRITDPECFDENPGAWHIAVVNQLGVNQSSFIIDATYDYQVWNQPVYGYEYSYFNPQTGESASSYTQAKVALTEFNRDKFSRYRSSGARAVVGIAMDLTYIIETSASHDQVDTSAQDRMRTVRYMYDLELDDNDQIIGGEWYTNSHPDFLWRPEKDTHLKSVGDWYLDREMPGQNWDGRTVVPATWLKSIVSSSKRSQPMSKIVDTLVILSKLGI